MSRTRIVSLYRRRYNFRSVSPWWCPVRGPRVPVQSVHLYISMYTHITSSPWRTIKSIPGERAERERGTEPRGRVLLASPRGAARKRRGVPIDHIARPCRRAYKGLSRGERRTLMDRVDGQTAEAFSPRSAEETEQRNYIIPSSFLTGNRSILRSPRERPVRPRGINQGRPPAGGIRQLAETPPRPGSTDRRRTTVKWWTIDARGFQRKVRKTP